MVASEQYCGFVSVSVT